MGFLTWKFTYNILHENDYKIKGLLMSFPKKKSLIIFSNMENSLTHSKQLISNEYFSTENHDPQNTILQLHL